MGRYSLSSQGRHLLRRSRHVLLQLEPNASGTQRFTITVNEYSLVVGSRTSFQQGFEEINRLLPKGAGPFFTPFSNEPNLSRGLPADRAWAQIQCFLNPRTGVVKKSEQGMVSLALDGKTVWCRQDGGDFVGFEICKLAFCCPLHRDTEHFCALPCRQRLVTHEEAKKAVDRCETAVTCPDRDLAIIFEVLQKCQHFGCGEVRKPKSLDWLVLRGGRMPEEQTPGIAVRNDRVMRSVALLHQPLMKETVQKLGKRELAHWAPPAAVSADAP